MSLVEVVSLLRHRFVPLRKADLFNASISANVNILPDDVVADEECLMRVCFACNTSGVLRAVITRNGVTVVADLNRGASLAPNAIYAFDVPLGRGSSMNLRYSVSGICLILSVDQIVCGA